MDEAKLKLKVEKSYGDFFTSYNKSGVARKYDTAGRYEMAFSYCLLNFDFERIELAIRDEVEHSAISLQEIFVQKDLRGTGFAQKLMNDTIKKVSEMGKTVVYLDACESWCKTPFDKLKKFYESFGFTQVGETTVFKLAL